MTVRNAGTTSISGWAVAWTFPDGQQISQLWGGQHTQTGASVSVRDLGWNGALGAGASTGFGFLASSTGANGVPATLTCTAR
ncbi:cellulose binding domain-containing protein [Micromonospora sagamiensis]|uniref:cellulose binding domain-containing protein n=1 Tax=Micromonospora sagamiensis TaxID=47875 RepID=UPI002467FBEB|nr:cellulose binding domain-containing protein [Micromonospora sagamiensis]